MNHCFNYILHKVHDPGFYPNEVKKDPNQKNEESTAKRAFAIALPFISMYGPLKEFTSISKESLRVYTHLSNFYESKSSYEGVQSILAIASIAGNYFHFYIGLIVSTSGDAATNFYESISLLNQEQYEDAFERGLSGLNNILYLGIMFTGSLEITLVSYALLAGLHFYQAKREMHDGKIPEVIAKTILGIIWSFQAKNQISLIQRRNFLFAIEEYKGLIERLDRGKNVEHLLNHPLAGIAYKVDENKTVFIDPDGKEYDLGANFFGNGKDLVKGMNVCFKKKDGKLELDFKVNHVHRDKMENMIQELISLKDNDNFSDLLKFSAVDAKNISIENKSSSSSGNEFISLFYQINIGGLGKIIVGSSSKYLNQYDRVRIQLDEGKNLFDFHQILTVLDLDTALKASALEDINRMKIGHLFRILYPTKATPFERSEEFFSLSIDDLKNKIIKLEPAMEKALTKYLPRLELREILPGKMRFAINGLGDELRELGALGLTAAITGVHTSKDAFKRVDAILGQMGMLSHETRNSAGISEGGLVNSLDHITGGDNCVFTQLVTDQVDSFSDFVHEGRVRVLFSLDAVETGTYQYHDDSYGYRRTDDKWAYWGLNKYLNRDSIFSFVKKETENPYTSHTYEKHTYKWFNFFGNEVMLKERVGPEYITGFVVHTESDKTGLIDHLKKTGKCHISADGEAFITAIGKKASECIHVGNKISSDYF